MLLLIVQTHTPENCPKDVGGSKTLYNEKIEGIELKAVYGDYANHTIYYVVEAKSLTVVNKFLDPGWTRCTSKIIPVATESLVR